MSELRSTYEISAEQLKAYVQPLWQGALAIPFDLHDDQNRKLKLNEDAISGKYVVLVFLNDCDSDAAITVLKSLGNLNQENTQLTTIIISSNSDVAYNRGLKQAANYQGPIVGDSSGSIFAAYGLHKCYGEQLRIVLLSPLRQVMMWFDSPQQITQCIEVILNMVTTETNNPSLWIPVHAPVLIIPNVFTPLECRDLIHSYEAGGPFSVRQPRKGEFQGNYKIPVYEHNRQDRVDHIIKDKNTLALIDSRIASRVTPLVKKSFAYTVTRREDLHIARYTGKRGGNQMGHRDNTSAATAYRRFAFSLNLNDGFQGGDVSFKEYNSQGYKAPPGTAIVFSSSLLHEVAETTEGMRYSLITHFYNEESIAK